MATHCRSGTAVGSPERAQEQRQIDALRWAPTRRGTGMTVGDALPVWNGGRVAGARTASAADRRAAGPGRRLAPRRQSGRAVGSPERAQRQRQIDVPRDRDDGRRHIAGAERRKDRRSVHSGSGRSTRCGIGTTVGTAPPEPKGGRVARARAATKRVARVRYHGGHSTTNLCSMVRIGFPQKM